MTSPEPPTGELNRGAVVSDLSRRGSVPRAILAGAALVLTGLLLAASAAALADPPATQPTGDDALLSFSSEASVSWVLVPAVVRDSAGYVKELRKEDFTLRVDGRPVEIASFDAGAAAASSLIVLQDLSGSMAGSKLEASREAIRYFVDAMGPGDEVAIATFASGQLRVEVPFTDDVETLREAVGAWEAWGTTALHDAVAWLPDLQSAGRNFKRAALLVTDGVDNASVLAASTARELVRKSDLPVHVVALGLHDGNGDGVDPASAAAALRRLAGATVGGFHPVEGPDELKELTLAIADELRFQYVLAFPTRAGPEGDHTLTVELGKRAKRRARGVLDLRHRPAYRGGPPAGA